MEKNKYYNYVYKKGNKQVAIKMNEETYRLAMAIKELAYCLKHGKLLPIECLFEDD